MKNLSRFQFLKGRMLLSTILLIALFFSFNSFKETPFKQSTAAAKKNAQSSCATITGLMLTNNTPSGGMVCAIVDPVTDAISYEWYNEGFELITTTTSHDMCATWPCAGGGLGGIYVRALTPCGYTDFAEIRFGYGCP